MITGFTSLRFRLWGALTLAGAAAFLRAAPIDELQQAARSGSADAQVNLALAYSEGAGVKKDFAQADAWYGKAAAQGNAWAEFQLGYIAETGRQIDYAAARVHYQKALAGNVPPAGLRLGLLLLDGWGGPTDRPGAVQLIQVAADAGNRTAQRILSAMYFAGFGLPRDLEFAAAWQQRAGESDVAAVAAADSLPERLRRHDDEGELADRWFELAAENDYRAGLTSSVASLAQADVDPHELTWGSQWLEDAAADGDPSAQWLLASLYLDRPQFRQQADLVVQARTLLNNARIGGSYDAAKVIENEVPGVSLEQAAEQGLTSLGRSDGGYPEFNAVMSSGDLQPKPYRTIFPIYPRSMRIAHVDGRVVVDFVVDPTGRVRRAFAVKPYQAEFAEAAVLSVNQWRFQPGLRKGHPVFVHLQVPIVFRLDQPSEFNLDSPPAHQVPQLRTHG